MSSGFDSMEEEGSTRRDGGGMHALSSAPRGGPDRYSHTLEGSPAPRRSALAGRTDGERSEQSSDAALTADYSSGGASSDSSDGFRVVGGARRDPFKTIESHYADVEQLLMEYGTDAFSGEDAHRRSVQLRDLIAQIDARFIDVLERRPEAVQGVKRKSHPAKITSFRRKVRGLDDQVLPNGTVVVLCPHASDCLSKYQLELFTNGDAVVVLSATGKGMDAVYTLRKAGAAEGEEPNPKFTAHADMLERDPLAYLLRKFRVLITEDIEEETFNSLEEVGEVDYDEMLEKLEALSATRELGGEN